MRHSKISLLSFLASTGIAILFLSASAIIASRSNIKVFPAVTDRHVAPAAIIVSMVGRPTTGTTQLPYHASSLARSIGTYVDDTIRFGNAVVNLGVRYEPFRPWEDKPWVEK